MFTKTRLKAVIAAHGLAPARPRVRLWPRSMTYHSSPEASSLEVLSESPEAEPAAQSTAALHPLPERRSRLVPYLAFAAVCVFWGTSAPAIRLCVQTIPPLLLSVTRFAVASVLLLGIVLVRRARFPRLRELTRELPGALALSLSNVLVTLGFARVEAGMGSLLLATTAFHFALFDWLWPGSRTRPNAKFFVGLCLGFVGVAVLLGAPTQLTRTFAMGSLALLVSSFTWAWGSSWQARHPSPLGPIASSAVQMGLSALLVLPFSLGLGERWPNQISWLTLATLAYLIITASVVAFVAFVTMLRHLPGTVVGLYTYVNPLVAALAGAWLLDEALGVRFAVAALVILGSVALVKRNVGRA